MSLTVGRSLWQRALGPVREFGWAAGLLYAVSRLLSAVSPRCNLFVYEMMAQPLDRVPAPPERQLRQFTFREIVAGDPEVAVMPARPDIKAARFEQGARCLGAFRRDTLAGYIWWSPAAYQEDEVRCTYQLPPGAAGVFDFDLYVLPEHRLHAGFMAVWHGFAEHLRRAGVTHSYSRMTRFNLPSRRAHQRLGSVCVGHVLVLKLGAFELLGATPGPRMAATTAARVPLPLRAPPA